MKQAFWLIMGLALFLDFIILMLNLTQRHKIYPESKNLSDDLYHDFVQMLEDSSEMLDAAVQGASQIVLYEANQKILPVESLKIFLNSIHSIANGSECVLQRDNWQDELGKNFEETLILEGCLNVIEIQDLLEGILDELVQSAEEISSLKHKFPGIIEASCSGDQNEEECKEQIIHSNKSRIADLLLAARINMRLINEIKIAFQENLTVCFEFWKSL